MNLSIFSHHWTISLAHCESCTFLGFSPDQHLFVEEFYEENWFAQHEISLSGALIQSVDEDHGSREVAALELPQGTYLPPVPPVDHILNIPLMREWGMREQDRVQEWAQALTISEKMALLASLSLQIVPMRLLGLAESRVLAETALDERWTLICRRLRLAIALPEIRRHASGLPYDYETIPYTIVQLYESASGNTPALDAPIRIIDGVQLVRPLDCLVRAGYLFISEAGNGDEPSSVHCWKVTG